MRTLIHCPANVPGVGLRVARRRMNGPTASVAARVRAPKHSPRVTARPSQSPPICQSMLDGLADVLVGVLYHAVIRLHSPARFTAVAGSTHRASRHRGASSALVTTLRAANPRIQSPRALAPEQFQDFRGRPPTPCVWGLGRYGPAQSQVFTLQVLVACA